MFLTGPVNNLTDYQVEFGGLLLGNGTQFRIPLGGINFLDLGSVKTMDVQRVWADGSFAGPDFSDVLLPKLDLKIIGGGSLTQFQANVAALQAVATVQATGQGLWFKLPGFPVMGLMARVGQRSIPVDERWLRAGYTIASLQFRAPDPAWQSVPRSLTLAASGSVVSGLVFPMFTPASYPYPVRTNWALNPDFETNTTSWNSAISATLTRTTSQFHSGTASLQVVTPGAVVLEGAYSTPAAIPGLTTGAPYSGSIWVMAPAGAAMEALVNTIGTGGSVPILRFTGTGSWQLVTLPNNTANSSVNPYILVRTSGVAAAQAITFYLDDVLIELTATPGAQFTGATPNANGVDYGWTGTPHASTSVAYTPVADFGATNTASSSGVLTNSGNTPAWPVVTIPGPSTGFTVQVGGGYVTYIGTLQASDTLVIDYSTGQATLNGTADRTALLTSRQFNPVPAGGTVSVFFTAPSGTCTIQTADIWR